MQDYQPSDGQYVTGAASVYPAYPFKMSARDLARFALLYLHKGKWQDNQIVPTHWVEESTQTYSRSEFGPGYGYLWWTGFLDNKVVPSVKLPPGTFLRLGRRRPSRIIALLDAMKASCPAQPLRPHAKSC